VTTRTRAGRDRVSRELGGRALATLAPLDFPQAVRALLRDAAPTRLDLIETELWPNLLFEGHRAGVPVVAVSATVSERTVRRLRSLGLSGEVLFGPLHVLAQSEAHAARFRALGVHEDRCRVVGDVKASGAVPAESAVPAADRRLVIFASLRPGEEGVAVALARALSASPAPHEWRFIVAPRHDEGVRAAEIAFQRGNFRIETRAEAPAAPGSVEAWAGGIGPAAERRVGILATRGELPALFGLARAVIVGGTFAPYGGHNVLEAAAHGAPVVVGPFHRDVESGVAALLARNALSVADSPERAAAILSEWLGDSNAERRQAGAIEAARDAAGAASRGVAALESWGLMP
jgi:3-deoxy-D-manno-octulosonic-acid transferase